MLCYCGFSVPIDNIKMTSIDKSQPCVHLYKTYMNADIEKSVFLCVCACVCLCVYVCVNSIVI